nr:PREDICTED: uncharacterized protein LOC109036464 [Bemisia tabaci]XP_018906243.1 PREDICTED: uncharacterized protein LOC109036464 [Bemisia tabaci]
MTASSKKTKGRAEPLFLHFHTLVLTLLLTAAILDAAKASPYVSTRSVLDNEVEDESPQVRLRSTFSSELELLEPIATDAPQTYLEDSNPTGELYLLSDTTSEPTETEEPISDLDEPTSEPTETEEPTSDLDETTSEPTEIDEPLVVSTRPSGLFNFDEESSKSTDPISAAEDVLYDDPYMRHVAGPLKDDDLEYSLDFYADKMAMKEFDFSPVDIARKLTAAAKAHGTQPDQFLEEIQDLIALQNRSSTEVIGLTNEKEVSQLHSVLMRSSLLQRVTDGWKHALKRLEEKYNVSAPESAGPESITATRLALMFPQYVNFGQKPFTEPSWTNVLSSGEHGFSVPDFFKRPEFSGFIPRDTNSLGYQARQAIIGTHLYALHKDNLNDGVPLRTKCVMLKRRIDKSLLSKERRIRFLKNNDIVDINGYVVHSILKTFTFLPENFTQKIIWDLFGENKPMSWSYP